MDDKIITIKTPAEVALMRRAGLAVYEILNELEAMAAPGLTTWDLEMHARKLIAQKGVVSAFKDYKGFPCVLCASLNDEVVHGIPSKKRKLEIQDYLKLDFGVSFQGWFADSARTVVVPGRNDDVDPVVICTKNALWAGIEAAKVGNRLGDICYAIKAIGHYNGYNGAEGFTGHGIGQKLHEYPPVPNNDSPWQRGRGPKLEPGMTFALEPMFVSGNPKLEIQKDGWTAKCLSGKVSAHFEHTIHITENGPEILTLPEAK